MTDVQDPPLTPEQDARYQRCCQEIREVILRYLPKEPTSDRDLDGLPVTIIILMNALANNLFLLVRSMVKAKLLKAQAPVNILRRLEKTLMAL